MSQSSSLSLTQKWHNLSRMVQCRSHPVSVSHRSSTIRVRQFGVAVIQSQSHSEAAPERQEDKKCANVHIRPCRMNPNPKKSKDALKWESVYSFVNCQQNVCPTHDPGFTRESPSLLVTRAKFESVQGANVSFVVCSFPTISVRVSSVSEDR